MTDSPEEGKKMKMKCEMRSDEIGLINIIDFQKKIVLA